MKKFDHRRIIIESAKELDIDVNVIDGENYNVLRQVSDKFLNGEYSELLWECSNYDYEFFEREDVSENIGKLIGNQSCILFFDIGYSDFIYEFKNGFDLEKLLYDVYFFDSYVTNYSLDFFVSIFERKFLRIAGTLTNNVDKLK